MQKLRCELDKHQKVSTTVRDTKKVYIECIIINCMLYFNAVLSHEAVGCHTPVSHQITPFICWNARQASSVSTIVRVDAAVNVVLLSTGTG